MSKFFPSEPGTFHISDPITGELDKINVTPEEEKIVHFLMDPLVDNSAIGPVWVRCLPCGKRVGLRGNMRFNPNKWLDHRSRCQNARDALRTIKREGRFHSVLPLEDIRYADEVVDREEAIVGRGVHSCMMPLLQRIAYFEVSRGRDPWVNLSSAPGSSNSSPIPPPSVASTSSTSHCHQYHQGYQQRALETRAETRSSLDSLTLPPLRKNPPPLTTRLPSVRSTLATQISASGAPYF